MEHVHQVLGGDIAGGRWREGAAADAADARVERTGAAVGSGTDLKQDGI